MCVCVCVCGICPLPQKSVYVKSTDSRYQTNSITHPLRVCVKSLIHDLMSKHKYSFAQEKPSLSVVQTLQ